MKWTVITVLSLVFVSTAFGADDYLASKALKEVQNSRRQIQQLSYDNPVLHNSLENVDIQLAMAESNLSASLQQVAPPPPPANQPVGYYCAAACTDSNKNPDLRNSSGASGQFESQARTNATNKAQSEYSCNWGVAVTECSPAYHDNTFDSGAACTDSNGKADLRTARGGAATSKVEAQVLALRATQHDSSCNWGAKLLETSSGLINSYCAAACTDSNGNPDSRTSKGAQGRNKSDATIKALIATQSAHSCSWGIVITSCEQQ